LESLFATLACIPSFRRYARRVYLNLDQMEPAISRLSICQAVSVLVISSYPHVSLDFDEIAKYLPPRVKRLLLRYGPRFRGSLETVAGIESLTLHSIDFLGGPVQALMPNASAESLIHLTIEDIKVHELPSIKAFTNLKHLRIKGLPWGDGVFGILQDFSGQLVSLHMQLYVGDWDTTDDWDVEDETLWRVFTLPCVRRLRSLHLQLLFDKLRIYNYPSEYVEYCKFIIEKLAFHLHSLEDLTLWGGLDFGDIHYIKCLKNLKSLKWNVLNDVKIDGRRAESEDVKAVLLEGLQGFVNKPEIMVQMQELDVIVNHDAIYPSDF
jgi:hypothetical protein